MPVIRKQCWLTGLSQAYQQPWRQLSSTRQCAADGMQDNAVAVADPDVAFLKLLSQSFMAEKTRSPTSGRPVLADLPAAAALMQGAVPQLERSQPLYDLPNFLETSYPQAGVQPRNPAYDWRIWARSRFARPGVTHRPGAHKFADQQQHEEKLALLMQTDAHMRLAASRQVIVRVAKLELAHMWYYEQQRQLQQSCNRGTNDVVGVSPGATGEEGQQVREVADAGEARSEAAVAGSQKQHSSQASEAAQQPYSAPGTQPSATAPNVTAEVTAGSPGVAVATADGEEDDIFAAADRRAHARAMQQQQQKQQQKQQEQQERPTVSTAARESLPAQVSERSPAPNLPPEVQLRLRELQRRAGAYGRIRTGSLAASIRNVGEAFAERISLGSWADGDTGGSTGMDGGISPELAKTLSFNLTMDTRNGGRRLKGHPADLQLMKPDGSASSPSYWADDPLLHYNEHVLALALRQNAAQRSESVSGPPGKASLAAAVASLSSSLPRPGYALGQPQRPSRPPATPVLNLLLDYLRVKYLDVLHAWEVAEQLGAAVERTHEEIARQQATVTIQTEGLLPAALRDEISRTWDQAAAAFHSDVLAPLLQPVSATAAVGAAQAKVAQRALAAPLDWSQAVAMLHKEAARCIPTEIICNSTTSTADASATGSSELHRAVESAFAPVLAAAVARHQALLAKSGHGPDSGRSSTATADASPTKPPTQSPSSRLDRGLSAASVVCFKETLVLDASSAFDDTSQNSRVTLEFDVDRLVASEPSLGGSWGARFLERLLAPPIWADAPERRNHTQWGSMAGRARRGAAARSAKMAEVYPVDVQRSFCPRTRTAALSTARYGSRQANRKLLLEQYANLLGAAAQAATGVSA